MRIILIIALVFIGFAASAQFRASISSGYGSYSQKDLKDFQEQIKRDMDIDEARITAQFPAWVYVSGAASYLAGKRFTSGVTFGWGSSGSRISYRDYSGYVLSDMLVSYTSVGITSGVILNPDSKWLVSLELNPQYVFSKMDFIFDYQAGDEESHTKLNFHSRNVALQGNAVLTRQFKRLGIDLRAGYNVAVKRGNQLLKGGDGDYLIDNFNQPVRVDWNGYRVELGVSWTFY